MAFEKGDIIWVDFENRHPSQLKHPAVIWQNDVDDESDFYGVMLTHSEPSARFDNVLMDEEHFESEQEVAFSNTHFVNQLFIKFQNWGPFNKSGRLTESGIDYIESNLTNTEPNSYVEYINKLC